MLKTSEFSIEVPAKWVLTGEHSVLRGTRALAFPYPEFTLSLTYRAGGTKPGTELTITANPFQSQIKALLGRACEWLKADSNLLGRGELEIQSRIPIGAGLGSSAALCVAVARFVLWKTQSQVDHWIPLATHLEDVFHGKSSGMDVNVIAHGQPILYSMVNKSTPLPEIKKLPRFELYDSGKRAQTRDCIKQVCTQPEMTRPGLDQKMEEATQLSLEALREYPESPQAAEAKLARAMNQAQACFEAWGLVPTELLEQKNELLKQGALAVKITGAGLGGFWVALWPSK
ncbi:MAG: hypothetical protein JST80_05765 [Bdellovibrionales bacterium]|nr:hypothetical protein [Bdellovibrionales bacterium]